MITFRGTFSVFIRTADPGGIKVLLKILTVIAIPFVRARTPRESALERSIFRSNDAGINKN